MSFSSTGTRTESPTRTTAKSSLTIAWSCGGAGSWVTITLPVTGVETPLLIV